eukprot:Gregarina_sp_Poly_1__7929@NODE_452_length_8287_cov_521_171290_g369_i0_p2_GENE_NODE_452_length_8287_cov_521_171290_g369_i0NODE_452_length_8287_cov_521_171290_g369_i0_p2_ORF_typecomplete_len398_score40_38HOIPUBA/PF16678_5/0_0014Integrin_beta/PF00362_18/0_24_NODE_452_length_8287_cov_521_171290_g369_i03061499
MSRIIGASLTFYCCYGWAGNGFNVTSTALKSKLIDKFGTSKIDELPSDDSLPLDILFIVDDAWASEPTLPSMVAVQWPQTMSLVRNHLSGSDYRVAYAEYNNKPVPGKGVAYYIADWTDSDLVQNYGASRCYERIQEFGKISDSEVGDALEKNAANTANAIKQAADYRSNSYEAIINAVYDPGLDWRPDARKLIIVIPQKIPENAIDPAYSAQKAMDKYREMAYPDHCSEWGEVMGTKYESEFEYGLKYNYVVDWSTLACMAGLSSELVPGFRHWYELWKKNSFHYTFNPFDPEELKKNSTHHCQYHEYPTSYEFYDWTQTLDDSWHIGWLAMGRSGLNNPDRYFEVSQLYGFGKQFVRGEDPALWQWNTMVRSGSSPVALFSGIMTLIKWATLAWP